MEDLEEVAQSFALKRVAMADYPEAHALDEVDWLACRLQFRELRKRFYKLWYPGLLKEQTSAPSDLSNYITNGFRHQTPWQACVVGLAGLDLDHMLLAADVALYQLWIRSVSAWQEARERKARFNDLHEDASRAADDATLDKVAPLEIREPDVTAEKSPDIAVWQDRRVPTFIVIDEPHNFAPQDPATPLQARVSERIASIAAEGRKYGLFVILASQRPQKLRRGLLSECENSCLLHLQSKVEQTFAAEAFGEPIDTVNKVREFDTGEALMMGRWVAGTPTCKFAPSRTTVGGGGLDRNYWTDPF